MDQDKKEILRSLFSKTNILIGVKSIVLTAIIMIGVIIMLFWGVALSNQWGDRQRYINNFGPSEDKTKIYLCSVNGKKLCNKNELIQENIYMAKLTVRNYFYFAYYPELQGQNILLIVLNLALIAKIFSKLKKKESTIV